MRSFILPPPPDQPVQMAVVNKRTLDDAVKEIETTISGDHYASPLVSKEDRLEFYQRLREFCEEEVLQLEATVDEEE